MHFVNLFLLTASPLGVVHVKLTSLKSLFLPFYYPTVNLSKKCEVYDSAATLYVKLNIASKQHYPATFDIEKKTKLNIVKAEYSRFHCAT